MKNVKQLFFCREKNFNGWAVCFFRKWLACGLICFGLMEIIPRADAGADAQDLESVKAVADPPCYSPPPGMIAWWTGDEHAYSQVSRHLGEEIGDLKYAPGKVREAFELDGISAGVVIPDDAALDFGPGNSLSIEAWIQVEAGSFKEVITVVDKRLAPAIVDGVPVGGAIGYALILFKGRPLFSMGAAPLRAYGHSDYYNALGADLRDGKFHHLVVSVDRSSPDGGRLFVDGQLHLTFDATVQSGDLSNSEPFRIGNHATPGYDGFFPGLIDEVTLYDRAIFAREVQGLFNSGISGKCRPLLSMDDGISAEWREQFFGEAYYHDPRAMADADPDQDGRNNLQEYIAGSNPRNPRSRFEVEVRLVGLQREPGSLNTVLFEQSEIAVQPAAGHEWPIRNAALISWTSQLNRFYRVVRRPSLSSPQLEYLTPFIRGAESVTVFFDFEPPEHSSFYFIEAQLPSEP
jgi:hypothetical protein